MGEEREEIDDYSDEELEKVYNDMKKVVKICDDILKIDSKSQIIIEVAKKGKSDFETIIKEYELALKEYEKAVAEEYIKSNQGGKYYEIKEKVNVLRSSSDINSKFSFNKFCSK